MAASIPPGRSLRLLIELGRGGMGVVYLALAQGPAGFTKLKVLKRLRPDLAGEPGAVQMFLEEGRLSARLHHPNIVQTNEVGFDGKHYFLEMEYLEGQPLSSLNKRASRSGGVPLPLAVYVLSQTLAGLHYAHELADHDGTPLAVVHRDVSPHNVFVTYDGQVKVLDFGIAKAAGSSSETKTGFIKGKVTYMAPEQVARQPLDRRVDVFAVGVMLWEALTGQRLWGDLDDFEIFLKLRAEAIPSPRTVREDAPDVLVDVCTRALSRDPGGRFATAAEMQGALESWLDAAKARVGGRELADQMGTLFAEDRVATRAEVEAQIRTTPVNDSMVGVPMLRSAVSGAVTGTGVGTTSKTVGGEGTRVRQARQIQGLRTIAIASLGVAAVASVAAGVVAIRNRRGRTAPVASVSVQDSQTVECTAATGCAEMAVCRRAKCVPLETEHCKVLAQPGDPKNERTLWIGTMFPTGTGFYAAQFGVPNVHAVDLMRRDFLEATKGLPSLRTGGTPRPVAIVACDDEKGERESAIHLAEEVGVSAVIGFRTGSEAIELTRDVFLPHGVFVATVNPSAQVTQVPQPGGGPRLVWRTAPASTLNAVPAARVVSEIIEPRLRQSGAVSDRHPMTVALLRQQTQYGLSMSEALSKNLTFNGRPALSNGHNYAQLVYDDPSSPQARTDYSSLVTRILELAPEVVLYAGQEELVQGVFAPVERRWPASAHRPFWVSVTDLFGKELFDFIGKDAALRRRFFGVSPPETSSANGQLAAHYSTEFAPISVNDTPAAAYDAAYLIAYAASVAGEGGAGGDLAAEVPRLLPPGPPVEVGPTHIFEAIEILRRGEHVDLQGANTRLDFDPATGESTVDWIVQCVGVDARGAASEAVESGIRFDPARDKLIGDLRCP